MKTQIKYMPIFRSRKQENDALKSFDFGKEIYPCVEIITEFDRAPSKPKLGAKTSKKIKKVKTFEDVYFPLIYSIKAERVFVDLPVHLTTTRNSKSETLKFMTKVVKDRKQRTSYLKQLSRLSHKIIPVISSYHTISGEKNTIELQAKDLRSVFPILAFRTFLEDFSRDINQIANVLTTKDYLIVDWDGTAMDLNDPEQNEIVDRLKNLKCTVIIHRNPIDKDLTNIGLIHKQKVENINNNLTENYKDFAGSCFSDYAGIKKDAIQEGGGISPGFVYYDAVENNFYGFKGEYKKPKTFESIIVPDVIKSAASRRMKSDDLDYLGSKNEGWNIIQKINNEEVKGNYAAIFKRIGVEHYLHCIRTRIENGDFD